MVGLSDDFNAIKYLDSFIKLMYYSSVRSCPSSYERVKALSLILIVLKP